MSTTVDQPPAGSSRRRVIVTSVIVAIVVIAAGFWWWQAHRKGTSFSAVFSASVGVYPGSAVKMLGVPVGAIDSVTPHGTTVTIDMHLDPGYAAAADTAAVIISPNLVSDRYVQLTDPWTSGPKLAGGTVIPASHTRTPVELDDLYGSLLSLSKALGPQGANSGGALSRLLNVGAANLNGNGAAFNTMITNLSQASQTLNASKDDIFGTIDNLQKFTDMLNQNNSNLQSVNTNLASVAQTFADDRQSFAEAMSNLASALTIVQQFIQNNRDALTANVSKLNGVAQTLAGQRASLLKMLSAAPLLVQNFINAYDPQQNLLNGRINLNELGVWSGSAGSNAAPSGMLPAANVAGGGK